MCTVAEYESPIGMLTMTSDGAHLTGLWIEGQKYFMAGLAREMLRKEKTPALEQAKRWLDRYFAGEHPVPAELPLLPAGTVFQRGVWKRLCQISWGKSVTYGEIAREIACAAGREHFSAQAVGGAVGRNPISIVIPCHRVLGAAGELTGYAGGLWRKEWLLRWEGVLPG